MSAPEGGSTVAGSLTDRRLGVLLCLAQLPEVGPSRLGWCASRDLDEIWASVVSGAELDAAWSDTPTATCWRAAAAHLDPAQELQRHRDAGVAVSELASGEYPARLACDVRPPPLLCSRGVAPDPGLPLVGIVGTRRASAYGTGVARELGAALAGAGVGVVSGLALGIDAAAHLGVLAAGGVAVGVVASGLDHVYPRRNEQLWRQVGEQGWLISEVPLGVEPQRWRFPVRNRVIAALSDVLVVVESNQAGGSMHTVREACQRGVTVMAVPGSIRTATSAGTNQLISEGCPPCCGVDDVLVALGLSEVARTRTAPIDDRPGVDGLTDDARACLGALGAEAATIDQLATRIGRPVGVTAQALIELRLADRAVERGGLWEQLS